MSYNETDLVVLKHIITHKKSALDFTQDCNEKVFSPDVWRFAKLVTDYVKINRDVPTLKILVEKNKKSNDALVKYIEQIWNDLEKISVNEKEFKHDLEKLKTRYAESLVYSLKDNLIGSDGRVDLKKSVAELNTTLNNIKDISQVKVYDQKTLKEGIEDFRTRYVAKQNNKNYYGGFKTGYSFLDYTLGSVRQSELFIFAAESGVGKSLIMMNVGINMWLGENTLETTKDFKPGANILYFSLEMPREDMEERVISRLSMVPQIGIRDASLNEEEKKSIGKTLKFVENYPYDFTIVDMPRGATMQSIENIYNDICATRNRKPDVVIIDYLALLSHHQKDLSDWLQLNYLSEELHEFARVHNIVAITASQLNRPNKNGGGGDQNSLHRLSRSSLIAANANFVAIIEKRPNEQELPNMQIHLIKSRRSALVSGTVHKQLACCALMNEAPESDNLFDNDISDLIE